MPSYLLFWSAHGLNDPDTQQGEGIDFKTSLAALSLANLGQKSYNEIKLDLNQDSSTIKLFCDHGVIGKMNRHAVALPKTNDDDEESNMDYVSDSYCAVSAHDQN